MIPAALPAVTALAQLTAAGDPPPADPAPAIGGADFAAMMAGVMPPPAGAADATDDAGDADDATPTKGKDARDDRDAPPGDDVALLAMLAAPPPAPATGVAPTATGGDTQAPAAISPGARAALAVAMPAPQGAGMGVGADGARRAVAAPASDEVDNDGPLPQAVAAAVLKLKLLAGRGDGVADPAATPASIAAIPDAATAPPDSDGTPPTQAADADDASTPAGAAPVAASVPAPPVAMPAPLQDNRPVATVAAKPRDTLGAALGERRLSLAQGWGWLDQLARDIASTAGVEGRLRFRLDPEHLGALHVEVTRGADGAAVRLTADTQAARDIIVDAQPQLVAEARAQGVRIAGTHVDLGGSGQSASGDGRREQPAIPPQVRAIGATAAIETTEPRGAASERYA